MKHKLLILTRNPVAKVGIASYLSSLFGQYLTIVSTRIADLKPEDMEDAGCILYTAGELKEQMPFSIPDSVKQLVCMRTFNHTYLQRILQIPPGSFVYLVNDTVDTTYEIMEQLKEYGFSQYHFLPYLPGTGEVRKDIQYCVTPGEVHLVPSFIHQVIDIGNRIVDISTINELIAVFKLPSSLADEVTKNYLNHIIQIQKLSNQQLSQALDMKEITRGILENASEGLCLLNQSGKIELCNSLFLKMTGIKERDIQEKDFSRLLEEAGIIYDYPSQNDGIAVHNGEEAFRMWFQDFSIADSRQVRLIHTNPLQDAQFPTRITKLCDFSYFSTVNPLQLHMLDTARRVSVNDFPIIIEGESGTEKELLAQAIHLNSRRHDGPFISLNISSLKSESAEAALIGSCEQQENGVRKKIGALEAAKGGTLLINNLQYADSELQRLLLSILKNGFFIPLGNNCSPQSLDLRLIVTSVSDLYSRVLEGKFLDELFFLLSTVSLYTIPLRQRRNDIPLLLETFLKRAFQEPGLTSKQLLTEPVLTFLNQYDWPGNVLELKNVCTYFSCIYHREPLSLSDLPGYILNQIRRREQQLDITEHRILSLIAANPRSGRSFLCDKLNEEGLQLTQANIRTSLQRLANAGYIKIHRTRGGCEITELGALVNTQ